MLQQKNNRDDEKRSLWMLFDSSYTFVSEAIAESRRGESIAVFRPLADKDIVKKIMRMHIVLFSSVEDPEIVYRGELASLRGGKIYIDMVERMDPETGHHLRVQMQFYTKIIREREGRLFQTQVRSIDLSIGGIAFECQGQLPVGEIMEIVIPPTEIMLVLKMRILHSEPKASGQYKYAGEFIDLTHEEEVMLQQAIFNEQWRHGKCQAVSGVRRAIHY